MSKEQRAKRQRPDDGRGKAYSSREAAEILDLAEGTLAVWRSTGRYDLPFCKIGGKVVYFERDLDDYIEKNMVRPMMEA